MTGMRGSSLRLTVFAVRGVHHFARNRVLPHPKRAAILAARRICTYGSVFIGEDSRTKDN